MGIDFSHCDAHWAYSGFHRFRSRLAEEIGIVLNEMEGFEHQGETPKKFKWEALKADPILDLFNHSDCDGLLTAKQCATIAPRLRELVNLWPEDDYDRMKALELAAGMDLAVSLEEDLEFL